MKILNGTDFKIINGYTGSDVEGEFTFCNTNGSSVIDLCILPSFMLKNVDFKVIESHESCHFPIQITLYINKDHRTRKVKVWKTMWAPDKGETFQINLNEEFSCLNYSDISVDEYINIIKRAAKACGMARKVELGSPRLISRPRWFDKRCIDQKKLTQKSLKQMKAAAPENREEHKLKYTLVKREYHNLRKAKRTLFVNRAKAALSLSRMHLISIEHSTTTDQ